MEIVSSSLGICKRDTTLLLSRKALPVGLRKFDKHVKLREFIFPAVCHSSPFAEITHRACLLALGNLAALLGTVDILASVHQQTIDQAFSQNSDLDYSTIFVTLRGCDDHLP